MPPVSRPSSLFLPALCPRLHETRLAAQENILMGAVGAISLALAFKYPSWAGWSFFLIGPGLALHGSIYGKRVRALAEKLGVG